MRHGIVKSCPVSIVESLRLQQADDVLSEKLVVVDFSAFLFIPSDLDINSEAIDTR